MVINMAMVCNINKTFWCSWIAEKLLMLLREFEYFQCFNIYASTYRKFWFNQSQQNRLSFLTCLKPVKSVI